MDFFQRQDKASFKTVWLVFLFILGLLSTAILIHFLVAFFVGASEQVDYQVKLFDPKLFAIDVLTVSCFILFVSFFRIASLKRTGPDGIAASLGG
ncbi:MAG: hypothetical protein J6X44_06140, partial [Thermoguttaceae bacterium]|nr:hypothetical protein [Thermoguttaceae bacterium]